LHFKEITLADREVLSEYLGIWSMDNAEHSFANLYFWRKAYQIKYCIKDEVLYIRFQHDIGDEPPILFSPLPKRMDVDYCKIMNDTIAYCHREGIEFKLQSVVQKMVDYIRMNCMDIFDIVHERDFCEYVYNVSDLTNLAGKKYHKKRNHIARFLENNPDHEFAPITPADIDDCKAMYMEWHNERAAEGMENLDLEQFAMFEALDNMENLGLQGALVRIGGKVKAFTIGERISDKTVLIHVEKADQSIQGLYPFINREFLRHFYSDMQYVNREEDLGIPGLRRSKESYYPAFLIDKYMVTLKEGITYETLHPEG